MKTLTVIPAKAGSTRLPKKNIRPFAGTPLLTRTVETAFASGVCGRIVVSTESQEVADIAREAGAEVPFMRPSHLARDPYEVNHVCHHALQELSKNGDTYDILIILLPTSPFLESEDIIQCVDIFHSSSRETVMSVSEFNHNPFGAMRMVDDEKVVLKPMFPDVFSEWAELPKAYRPNGAVCVICGNSFIQTGNYYEGSIHGHVMPAERGVDIDTELDFQFAEFLLESRGR